MNTQRDELLGTLSNTICNASNYPHRAVPYLLGGDMSTVLDKTADELLAAGYSKPRTIETVEELDRLPAGSVILDRDGDAWQMYRGGWNCTDRASNTVGQPSSSLVNVLGPATVLYEPGAGE